MDKTCLWCEFFHVTGPEDGAPIQCRRRSPIAGCFNGPYRDSIVTPIWPNIKENDSCGDWTEDPDA